MYQIINSSNIVNLFNRSNDCFISFNRNVDNNKSY